MEQSEQCVCERVCVCARECLRCGQLQDVAQVVALVGDLEGSQAAVPEEANEQQKKSRSS